MGNWGKYSIVVLALIGIHSAAMGISKAVDCTTCVEILAPFGQKLTAQTKTVETPSGTTVISTTVVE